MKLKKIASLALAGIMAVSMLAGCKDGGNGNSGSSSENTGTATGYSAMLGQKAAETLSKKDLDEIFSFTDDADDQKALEKVVLDNIAQSSVQNILRDVAGVNGAWALKDPTVVAVDSDFRTEIKADNDIASMNTRYTQNTATFANVWVANGEISMDTVMAKVFEDMKTYIENAADNGKPDGLGLNYSYNVSVSVKNEAVKYNTTRNGSVNFIAVTVTRTAKVA